MEKHILSKSTYIKGEQCLKQLYLHKKRSFLRDRMPAERLAIFRRGTDVGIYAQELFPGGVDAGPKHPSQYRKAVEKTAQLIKDGQEIIYEAGFQANKTLILLDILVKNGDKWDAYEVKSSIKLSETYYKDAALQYYVLEESGLNINTFSLVNIDKNYIREKDIDIKKLFTITDVTEEVRSRKESVRAKIEQEIKMLDNDHSPKIKIGKHCFEPYDCDFIGHCWKGIEKPSIFDIPSIDIDTKFKIYNTTNSLNTVLQEFKLSEINKLHISSQLNKEEVININKRNKSLIEDAKKDISNIIFLKILKFAPALPLYPNTKPYQLLSFAVAYTVLGEKIDSNNFIIADGKANPNTYINDLLKAIIGDKHIITYNSEIEGFRNFDLSQLLDSGEYYHPAIQNDYSNKSLSKALGIKPPWKGISLDIVAAQYYDEILRNHKKSGEKREEIIKYLRREIELLEKFWNKIAY